MTQEQQWCRHFTGIYNQTCEAGIRYDSVRDSSHHPYRWPCIVGNGAATSCNLFELLTAEEWEEHERQANEAIKQVLGDIASGRCPVCHQVVERKQVGRCVYGSCGHRMYQGKA